MPIPAWKYWLSYLTEVMLEETSSTYNPVLEVSLKRGQFALSTANAIYSYGDRYVNFSRTFDRMHWASLPGQEVLLLGLGLGSIPYMLEKNYRQAFYYTAIDIDEVVIGLADKYLLANLKSNIQSICADAEIFVAVSPDETYDLICVDLFSDDQIPEPFKQADFQDELARILSPGGLVLYNCLAFTPQDRAASELFFNTVFLAAFPQACMIPLDNNLILASDQRYFRA